MVTILMGPEGSGKTKQLIAALNAGKNVLCEKSMTPSRKSL